MKKLLSFIMTACMILSLAVNFVTAGEGISTHSEKDDFFKVLLIGNSLSDDASDAGYTEGSTLHRLLKSMVGEDTKVAVGLVWSGGKTLAWHATVAEYGMTEGQQYTFGYIEDGTGWTYISGVDSSAGALEYTDWDAVVLQPYGNEVKKKKSTFANGEHGDFIYLEDSSAYMLDHVATYAPGADVYLYQVHADANDAESNTVFDVERDAYEGICKNIRKAEACVGTKTGKTFKATIPVGAAIQAARGTYLAKLDFNSDATAVELYTDPQIGLQRDGVHLTFEIGRYIAGLTFAEVLIPEAERAEDYTLASMRPSDLVGEMPEEYHEIARLSVAEALASAKLSGDKKYNVKSLKGFEESPIAAIGEEISALEISVEATDSAEELEALVEEEIAEKCSYDITCEVTAAGYTQPAEGESATVSADVSFRHGYITGSCSVTVEAYLPEITEPETSEPETSEPETSEPETSEPETSEPETSEPETTEPEETDPPVYEIFEDVPADEWYVEYVEYVYDNNLMKGTSDTLFEPEASMTRAMVVTVLWRCEGSPEPDGGTPFADLSEDWYLKSVAWAYKNEIVKGTGETEFDPDGVITREQMAAIFYRYAGYKGYNTGASANISVYPDADSVSDYAVAALSWATAESIITGTNEFGSVILDPTGYATRAQGATIFKRFLEKY